MKAIIKNTSLNYDYYNTYNISLNETTSVDVKVSANVYKVANEIDCYDIEINDTEVDYYVYNKKTIYSGYKSMYTQMYGETQFSEQEKLIEETAIKEFSDGLKDRKLLMNLTPAVATRYIKRLLKLDKKHGTLKATMTVDNVEKEITYTSSWVIAKLAKVINEDFVFKLDCQYTNGKASRLHLITDVSSFL